MGKKIRKKLIFSHENKKNFVRNQLSLSPFLIFLNFKFFNAILPMIIAISKIFYLS